jgi:hypothetical protein
MNSLPRIPDVTVGHFQATLLLDWKALEVESCNKLGQLDGFTLPDTEFSLEQIRASDPQGLDQVLSRCGAAATNELVRLGSQTDFQLDFTALQTVQQHLIGRERCEFRQESAYVAVRPERYGWFDGIERMFRIKIRKDARQVINPLLKAIRLYLDILFVHPFEDGNARAGMLWFAYYCWRSQLRLPDFRKIHGYVFTPGSRLGYVDFCNFVLEETQRHE